MYSADFLVILITVKLGDVNNSPLHEVDDARFIFIDKYPNRRNLSIQ